MQFCAQKIYSYLGTPVAWEPRSTGKKSLMKFILILFSSYFKETKINIILCSSLCTHGHAVVVCIYVGLVVVIDVISSSVSIYYMYKYTHKQDMVRYAVCVISTVLYLRDGGSGGFMCWYTKMSIKCKLTNTYTLSRIWVMSL